ncbi:MAG: DMT family transporter [Nitrososphaerota archaeon]|nr:DMT family transporter [Nitrososphaerota archaeon]MDG7024052.1 DMT family transporter [Nitrososphaerota archaeon]
MDLKSVTAYSGLAVLSVIWGMAFVAIKAVVTELSPINLALLRWFIAGVPFLILLPIIGRPKVPFERKDIPRLLVVALANVAGYHISLYYAETTISAGMSALLTALGPLFIAILSYLILNETSGRRVVAGLGLATFGTVILSLGSISVSDLSSYAGIFEALVTAFCYALFTVLGKPLVHKYGSASTTILAGLVGTAMMLPLLSGSFVSQTEALSFDGWVGVVYLALLSTVFGYLMFYTLVRRGAVTELAIQLYLIPVIGVIGGALLLAEAVTPAIVFGGGLMLFAVGVTTWKGRPSTPAQPPNER